MAGFNWPIGFSFGAPTAARPVHPSLFTALARRRQVWLIGAYCRESYRLSRLGGRGLEGGGLEGAGRCSVVCVCVCVWEGGSKLAGGGGCAWGEARRGLVLSQSSLAPVITPLTTITTFTTTTTTTITTTTTTGTLLWCCC